ncbi:CYTH domain-containing protein [Enterobacter asburiae]|uniref:hypothetical protein n=1 Tax=Enterobacter asburiae TaxID=61645 RepID=UPI00387DCC72
MTMKIVGRVVGGLHQRRNTISTSASQNLSWNVSGEVWPDGELPSTLAEQVQPLFSPISGARNGW